MLHKIITPTYPSLHEFHLGSGFYEVFQSAESISWLYYYNDNTKMFFMLEEIKTTPLKVMVFLKSKYIAEKEEEPQEIIPIGMVSETFALKAMAIAKANTQTIKISDII